MEDSGYLHKYFLNNNKRPSHKWIHYFDIYERHFSRFRDKNPLVIEIGVYQGGSLQMWSNYFGKDSKILGIDIEPWCKEFEESNISIEIGNQNDVNFLEYVINKYGNPDIIIDDGGHISNDMKESFKFLYPKLRDNGIYLIEDIHANYWSHFGSDTGLKNPNSFIEFSKDKIDEINAPLSNGAIEITELSKTTSGIHFYDSVIVFEKKKQTNRIDLRTFGI